MKSNQTILELMNCKRNPSVVWEVLNGAVLLVDAQSGTRVELSGTASELWRDCDGSMCITGLATKLQRSTKELREHCDRFIRLGLLIPNPGEATVGHGALALSAIMSNAPAIRGLGVGNGPRRRPTPRGNSGPG